MILTVILDATINKRYVVDNLQNGNLNKVNEFTYTAGGKGINIARVAAITGEKVTATGFLGGYTGTFIAGELEDWGINTNFVNVSAENRVCLQVYDNTNKLQTEFTEPGGYVTNADQEELLTKYIKLVEKCSVVVISGSVPKGVDSTFYQCLIKLAKEKKKKVILNTNGILLKDSLKTLPGMIKLDLEDIKDFAGKPEITAEEALEAAKGIQKSGIEVVVFFNGEKDARVICKEGVFEANIHTDKSICSIGCEEAMVAGFAAGYSKGLSIKDTIQFASAISAAKTLRLKTGLFLMKDMEDLKQKIQVKQICG